VRYNDYGNDIGLLAEKVLQEVPDQFVDYMLEHGIKPKIKGQLNKSDSNKTPTAK
jgi:hypothetical protein